MGILQFCEYAVEGCAGAAGGGEEEPGGCVGCCGFGCGHFCFWRGEGGGGRRGLRWDMGGLFLLGGFVKELGGGWGKCEG